MSSIFLPALSKMTKEKASYIQYKAKLMTLTFILNRKTLYIKHFVVIELLVINNTDKLYCNTLWDNKTKKQD